MNPIQTFAITNFISDYLEISEIAQYRCICKDTKNVHPRIQLYKQIYMKNFHILILKDLDPFRNQFTEKDIDPHFLYRTVLITLFNNKLTLYRIVRACNIHYLYGIWDDKQENSIVKNVIDTLNSSNLSQKNLKYIESFFSLRQGVKNYQVFYEENKIIFIDKN